MLDLIAIMVYAAILCFATIGAILYFYAYMEMKRTRIIGSVALLLVSIGVDTAWWLMTEYRRFVGAEKTYSAWMVSPGALILTKIILLAGVMIFVINSVREDKGALRACAHALKNGRRKKSWNG